MNMTKPSKNVVDVREVYTLISSMRLEIGGSIKVVDDKITKLDDRFIALESGRLSKLEKDFAEYKAELAPVKKVVYGMIAIILVTVLGAIVVLVINK